MAVCVTNYNIPDTNLLRLSTFNFRQQMSAKCRDRLNSNPIRILFLEYEFGCICKFFNYKLTLYYLRMRGPMILEMSKILEKN